MFWTSLDFRCQSQTRIYSIGSPSHLSVKTLVMKIHLPHIWTTSQNLQATSWNQQRRALRSWAKRFCIASAVRSRFIERSKLKLGITPACHKLRDFAWLCDSYCCRQAQIVQVTQRDLARFRQPRLQHASIINLRPRRPWGWMKSVSAGAVGRVRALGWRGGSL